VGGVVSQRRDRHLADALFHMVKACCQAWCALLVLTDGWAAYPGSMRRALREKVKEGTGRGRSRLQAWPEMGTGTVINKTVKTRVVEVIRRLSHGGAWAAIAFLAASHGGTPLKTACLERVNATFGERLASLTGRTRHAARKVSQREAGMWLVGRTSNGCWPQYNQATNMGYNARQARTIPKTLRDCTYVQSVDV
jgi:hypothetical protein